jgi:hypothetical protein
MARHPRGPSRSRHFPGRAASPQNSIQPGCDSGPLLMSSRSLLGPEQCGRVPIFAAEVWSFLARSARFPKIFGKEPPVKEPAALLSSLKDISKRLNELASDKGRHELDADAIVDLAVLCGQADQPLGTSGQLTLVRRGFASSPQAIRQSAALPPGRQKQPFPTVSSTRAPLARGQLHTESQ